MDTATSSVLIVEDDPLIRDTLAFKMREKGWDVRIAFDGDAALQEAKKQPDIIMLDILLPGMSGYVVLEVLKADPETKDIPVLILSNYGQPEQIEKSLSLGAVDHLVKVNITLDQAATIAHKIVNGEYIRTPTPVGV